MIKRHREHRELRGHREHRGFRGHRGLMLLLAALLLVVVGCSEDDDRDALRQKSMVEVVPCVSSYNDIDADTGSNPDVEPITRADLWPPTGYKLYHELTGVNGILRSNETAPIAVFFTSGTTQVAHLDNTTVPHRFVYNSSTTSWRIDEELENAGEYLLYGFVPYSAATNAVIGTNSTFENEAILTLNGLNSVMNQDVCVIVGAKNGKKEDNIIVPVEYPKTGEFACTIHKSETNPNYIYLLFDHLYAALRFRFRVDETYAALRTIKLKKLELLAYQDEACTRLMTKKVKTVVTLRPNHTNTSPIVYAIEFTPDGGGDMSPVLIYDNESNPVALPTGNEWTESIGFVPKTSSYYLLTSTYDVYDKQGNLIRQNCTADNKINPRKLFQKESLDRGYMYTMKLLVKPTYLYMLSEPDLDNPTMVIAD